MKAAEEAMKRTSAVNDFKEKVASLIGEWESQI